MPYKPGQSGNLNVRPKKDRALTSLLEKAGGVMVEMDGTRISGRRLMARQVWEGITTGCVSFPDGKKLALSPQDWKDFVKWAYGHIDGPPPAALDITSEGKALIFRVVHDDDDRIQDPLPGPLSPEATGSDTNSSEAQGAGVGQARGKNED